MAGGNRRPNEPDPQQVARDRLESRIGQRLDDTVAALAERSEASFKVVIEGMGSLQAELRKGQIDRQTILSRLGEFEVHLGENRDATNALRQRVEEIERTSVNATREAVETAAPVAAAAAASATRQAPRELWSSLSNVQKFAATIAAIVAILAGLSGAMTGLERLVKGGWEGLRAAWVVTRGPEKPTKASD